MTSLRYLIIKSLYFLTLTLPIVGFCDNASSFIWQATYYHAIPKQNKISHTYCQQHEPGTFIGVVEDQLAHGAITNHHIKLDHFTFQQRIKNGIYFMQGTLVASGVSKGVKWRDKIHYYVYKLTENGVTQGVWSSQQCKGFYRGLIVKK